VLEGLGVRGDVTTVSGLEVSTHSVVVREDRGGSSDLGTHVTDGSHTGTREGLDTGSVVLDDSTGSSLNGQSSGNREDDVCERRATVSNPVRCIPPGKHETHPWG
jgi:hypothetical protein